MSLFGRNTKTRPSPESSQAPQEVMPSSDGAAVGSADAAGSGDKAGAKAPKVGPFDSSQVDARGARVDLGSLWIPALPGLQVRMEVDKRNGSLTGVSVVLGQSSLQIQAFAAPKTSGIWDDIRAEIADAILNSGGQVDDVPGPFGRELIAQLPAKQGDSAKGPRPARFIGVDGPRWFLRGVITGKAATDKAAATMLEGYFGQIVVVRDSAARPPRDLLPLTGPNKGAAGAQAATPAQGAQGAAATQGDKPAADFDPLTRGPEITEVH